MRAEMKNCFCLALLVFEAHMRLCKGMYDLEWNNSRSKLGCFPSSCFQGEEDSVGLGLSRRVLEGEQRYISYGALKRDHVPCATPGASYYNCHPVGKAHPYNRGCLVITGCARDTHF